MEWLTYVVATLFVVLGAACVFLVVIQLPGVWIMLALAGLIEFADRLYLGGPGTWTFKLPVLAPDSPLILLLGCVVLALIGEGIEFIAGVLGAQKGGASRRGMIGSLIGGIVGVFLFTPIFFFIPLFGSLFGAILGTFVGAVIGELSAERATVGGSMRPALGATIGRVIGTTSKVGIALVVWLVLSVAAFWP